MYVGEGKERHCMHGRRGGLASLSILHGGDSRDPPWERGLKELDMSVVDLDTFISLIPTEFEQFPQLE